MSDKTQRAIDAEFANIVAKERLRAALHRLLITLRKLG
jgi:hypothetical protein